MPAPDIGALLRNRKSSGLHEVNRHKARYVSHRKMVARNKRPVLEAIVENMQEFRDTRLIGLGPGRHLGHLYCLHGGMAVSQNMRDREQKMEFKAPVPHFDRGD